MPPVRSKSLFSSLPQCRQCIQRVCSGLLFKITIQKCWSRLHCALSRFTLLYFATCMDMHGSTLVSTSKFLQDALEALDALGFFCTCRTCENTAIYRTGATLACKMAA